MKKIKAVNGVFCWAVVLNVLFILFASIVEANNVKIELFQNLFLSQVTILVPGLIFLLLNNDSVSKTLHLKGIKLSTALLMVLFTELILPLALSLNVISQFFTVNEVAQIADEVAELPFPLMFLFIGVIGPVCEEVVFRGVIFFGFKDNSKRVLMSAFLSGLFFGLMHMNLNQFCYTIVIGIIFAIVDAAFDSIIPSIIGHVIINAQNVLLVYIPEFIKIDSNYSYEINGSGNAADILEQSTISEVYVVAIIAAMLIVSIISTSLAVALYFGMCKNENVKPLFFMRKTEGRRVSILTMSGVVGIIICGFVIFLLEPLVEYISMFIK